MCGNYELSCYGNYELTMHGVVCNCSVIEFFFVDSTESNMKKFYRVIINSCFQWIIDIKIFVFKMLVL